MSIFYRGGYKYQLAASYCIKLDLNPPPMSLEHDGFITLTPECEIIISAGYAWDGASGPTWDDSTNMRAALIHDALYQLMREGYLDHEIYKDQADRILQAIMIEDGAAAFRAWYYYQAVKRFGMRGATEANINPILSAP